MRGGIVQLFSADGGTGYYSSTAAPPHVSVQLRDSAHLIFVAHYVYAGTPGRLDAVQQIDLTPTGAALRLTAQWDGIAPVTLEWNAARLWAYLFLGSRFTAVPWSGGDTKTGDVPFTPAAGAFPSSAFARSWREFTFRGTSIGDVALTAAGEGASGPALYDGRRDPWLQGDRVLWCGYPGVTLAAGRPFTAQIMLSLTSPPPVSKQPAGAEPVALPVSVVRTPEARGAPAPLSDSNGEPIVIPQPKEQRWTGGVFPLTGRVEVFEQLPDGPDRCRLRDALNEALERMHRQTGVDWVRRSGDWQGRGLLFALGGDALKAAAGGNAADAQARTGDHPSQPGCACGAPNRSVAKPGAEPPVPPAVPEGYALTVGTDGAAIVGSDAAGAFYGLQTLEQLLRTGDDGAPRLVCGAIRDWPSLRFRGAHLFLGSHALPFHEKLIERVLSHFKLNTLVLESEYTRWRSHPELWTRYSMRPDDLRADVGYARRHFMQPVPLISSLGHVEWMFKNGRHRDLAEDVESPHAYNASDPAAYDLLFDVLQETLDIFHPRLLHIGHDEVYVPNDEAAHGRFPARPENAALGATRIFCRDTHYISDWLRERGVRTMMWGDMLLSPGEDPAGRWPQLDAANAVTAVDAQQRRDGIPGDTILCDWRYEPGSERRNGLDTFLGTGREAIGCAWFQPENIRGWARECIRAGALGTLQTTWAGYDIDQSLLDDDLKQFSAFVYAAEYAWSGTDLHPQDALNPGKRETLPYTAEDVFLRQYRGAPRRMRQPGWYVDLSQAANIVLAPTPDGRPWAPLTAGSVPGAARPGQPLSNTALRPSRDDVLADATSGVRCLCPTPMAGVMLTSWWDNTQAVRLPSAVALVVGRRARHLAFLHAANADPGQGVVVGRYLVEYADGKKLEVPLRIGKEIAALDDPATAVSLRLDRIGPPDLRGERGIRPGVFLWDNPKPGEVIRRIVLRTASRAAAPMLFAITGW